MKKWTIVAYPECDEGYLPRQEREIYAKDWDEALDKAWDLWPEYHNVGVYKMEGVVMSKIIQITCFNCKEEFTTEPYFCNTDLYTQEDPKNGRRYHTARTVAMAICPNCGETNGQVCENEIFKQDIIDLAIRRYKRG